MRLCFEFILVFQMHRIHLNITRILGPYDSQSHIVWYPFFADLREDKSLESDKDLVEYFIQVLKIREDRKNSET